MANTKTCGHCKYKVPSEASICAHCSARFIRLQKKNLFFRAWASVRNGTIGAIVGFLGGGFLGAAVSGAPETWSALGALSVGGAGFFWGIVNGVEREVSVHD